MNLPQLQELKPKHIGAIINRNIVQKVCIRYCICNVVVWKMCNINVQFLL